MYKAFLIKYAEIAIKGKNRYLFEDALVSQMNHALKKVDGTFRIRKEQGRIYIEMDGEYDYDEAVEALKCVFGIVGICPVVILEDEGFDKLAEEVIHHIDEAYPDKHFTFKVNARRARKNYPLESMEINAQLGERILNAFPETRVDVHKPEVVINVEIRNQINVYSTVIPGPGGMPVGTNGKAMLLLSGGIDIQHNQAATLSLYATADIGIHYFGWEKEKNAAFWSEYGVDDTATVKRITDLILEEPGNYLKYYVGYLKFRQMREQLALENKSFSVSAFHEAILRTGPSPFSVLEETVRDQLK